ncbi:MAG TPA: 23S rRNA (adenine(2503)-C(2))-methyltransferase RlmN [Solirubrobacteraceae bacterium]|jgi:23S rRNA (adenine2503-C2)-methyltransferase|nr:23S rRNA (adenine(2503)-C(2))-methyltransferase RlmN [Solirubrobacteraceae bacterium]
MDLQLLEQTLADRGEPAFRARQIWRWAAAGAEGFHEMTDLPAALRESLASELPFSSLTLRSEAHARDGTVKALFATADERPLEAVLMRYRDGRSSICVSSQSGCPLTCTFCATGRMSFARNLTASEIVEQALHFTRMQRPPRPPTGGRADGAARRTKTARQPISNCVFMGMGEPMLNIENVLAACERLPDLGITHRRTAISTVGWIPGIERLAEQDMPLRLALSLHAADEALRSQLMPVNDRYPLADVIDACRAFYERKRRRVFVEYVMLAGVNDRYEQALALARVLSERREDQPSIFKVNLIPYNPTGSDGSDPYRGSTRESIAAFRAAIEARGIPATVRLTRGRDIDAACGQLAARVGSS